MMEYPCDSSMSQFSLHSIVAMAGSIKLFQFVQSIYQTMGIYSHQLNQHFVFNIRKMYFLFGITFFIIGHFGYFLSEKTYETFYRFISQLITLLDLMLTIWRMPTILHLIETCEKFIDRSKYQCKLN